MAILGHIASTKLYGLLWPHRYSAPVKTKTTKHKAQLISASELAAFAKQAREAAHKTRAEAARDLGVNFATVFHAEETPSRSLFAARKQMIERYTEFKVVGPMTLFKLERK